MMLIVLLICTMIFSPMMMANEKEYENIEVDKEGNLILTPDQYIQLADYISELEAENKKLKAKLEQAEIELKKAYEENNDIDITGKTLTAAGIAALIIMLANSAR